MFGTSCAVQVVGDLISIGDGVELAVQLARSGSGVRSPSVSHRGWRCSSEHQEHQHEWYALLSSVMKSVVNVFVEILHGEVPLPTGAHHLWGTAIA